ncbi:MAG: hypothetical protein U0Q12_25620 [Vicinamibacterales bacterium]
MVDAVAVEYVPLLRVQRDLYSLPRGMDRFRAYIATMVDAESGDLALPLVAMNPMGRDHVPALIDEYLRLDADGLAGTVVRAASTGTLASAGTLSRAKVSLVVADDLKGGWTNRYCTEFTQRFESRAMYRRGWLVGLLWTSESPSAALAEREALAALYRGAHIARHGFAATLGELLAQEGAAMRHAGWDSPTLDADDLAYTRHVIAPLAGARDRATIMACIFGDEAATTLGYQPRGLSARAGLALALADAAFDDTSRPSVRGHASRES